jgi:type IV pilus assembly protein PilO
MKRQFGLNPILLIALCCFILFGGLGYIYLYLINPLDSQIATIQTQIQSTQSQIQMKQNQLIEAKQIDVNKLLDKLPTNKDVAQYLMLIDHKATDSHCEILSLAPSQGATGSTGSPDQGANASTSTNSTTGATTQTSNQTSSESATSLPSSTFDLSGSASSFSDLNTFIHTLENLSRITFVQALHFTGSQGSGISFSLTLTVFYDPSLKVLGISENEMPYILSAHKTSP